MGEASSVEADGVGHGLASRLGELLDDFVDAVLPVLALVIDLRENESPE